MSETEVEERPGINWIQVVAGALAAVSSAVLLSTLGVAGTVIGAALGSVIASVASAWYSRGIDASRQQVAAQAAALKRVAAARSRLDDAASARERGEVVTDAGLLRADRELEEAEQALEQASNVADGEAVESDGDAADVVEPVPSDPLYGAEAGRQLPWKRIGLIAAGIFVAAMVAITAFELTTGRAVSEYTGGSDKGTGSTVPGIKQEPDAAEDEPAPDEEDPPGTTTPSDEVEPSSDPTTAPTETPSTPSTEPSATPSPTATPSAEPSVSPDGSTG